MEFLSERLRFLRPEDDPGTVAIDNVKDPSRLTHLVLNTKVPDRFRAYHYMRLSEIDECCPREWVIGWAVGGRRGNLCA